MVAVAERVVKAVDGGNRPGARDVVALREGIARVDVRVGRCGTVELSPYLQVLLRMPRGGA
jgi:hypothetical protein